MKKLTEKEIALFHDAISHTLDLEKYEVVSEVVTSDNHNYAIFICIEYKNKDVNPIIRNLKMLKLLRQFGMRGTYTLWGYTKEKIGVFIPDEIDISVVCGMWLLRNYDKLIE